MKFIKYIITTITIISLVVACSNSNKEEPSKPVTVQVAKKQVDSTVNQPTQNAEKPTTKEIEKNTDEQKETHVPVDKPIEKAKDLVQEKTKEPEKQTQNETEKQAKVLAEKQRQEEAANKAKALADKKAKEEAAAKEAADKKAKTLAEQKAKAIAEQKAKELADQKAKEEAMKKARELADKKVKEADSQQTIDAKTIIDKVDKNMISDTQISITEMVIHGKRNSRTIRSKGYSKGDKQSFSEYLSPAKEKGTKMLKLDDRLWIYSPDTDRSIQLSGHMLKQSVMGSDLSYEDMMEDRKLTEVYDAKVVGEETIDGRLTWVLELNAKVNDASYEKRKMWIDQKRYVPLKEELFAKSGQVLKKTTMSDVQKIDGRWFPKKMNFKDMLKSGKGTDFIIIDIQFNPDIPDHIFSKASLKK